MAKGKTSHELYREVSERFVAALKNGYIPWHREWAVSGGLHRSVATKKPYRGVNPFLLDLVALDKGYSSSWWLTYNKARKLGGHVRKGEKSTTVIFWKLLFIDETNEKGEEVTKVIPMLRDFPVFNIEQCEGVEAPKLHPEDVSAEERAAAIVHQMPEVPEISHGHPTAVYLSGEDEIHLPYRDKYDSFEGYYTEVYKQLVHSTAHSSRLNRLPDSAKPQKEKLIGEFGAGILCGLAGIKVTAKIADRDAYIDSWVEAFEDDHRLIVNSASKAQKAADFIIGEDAEEEE